MDCRCSTIAFVALPAVMSLHLKLFELCKLVCSKVTKCQTQVETYPTGTSSVALHLKFSFQKTSESTRQAKVPGPGSQVSQRLQDAIQFSWHSNTVSFKKAQDMFVLRREHKEETKTQSRKALIMTWLSIFNFETFDRVHLVEAAALTHPHYPGHFGCLLLGMTWLVMTVWQRFRKSPKIIQSWTSQKNCELSWPVMTCLVMTCIMMTCIRTAVDTCSSRVSSKWSDGPRIAHGCFVGDTCGQIAMTSAPV